MQRRVFVNVLASALALALVPLPGADVARADLVAPSPPPVDVRAHATTYAGAGAPASAQWEIHNRGREAITVQVARAVLLLPSMRLPLRIGAVRVDGHDAPREITIPAGGTVVVEAALADFSEPSAREGAWEIELQLQVRGGGDYHSGHAVGTTRVTRASRTAAR